MPSSFFSIDVYQTMILISVFMSLMSKNNQFYVTTHQNLVSKICHVCVCVYYLILYAMMDLNLHFAVQYFPLLAQLVLLKGKKPVVKKKCMET